MGADPVTLTIVATALTAAAAGTQMYGQYQEGQAAKEQAQYQAQVAENNSLAATYAAQDARARGRQAELDQRAKNRLARGNYRANAAQRGVLVDSGSAGEALVDAAGVGEVDALMIRSNAEREALGYESQGREFMGESRLRRASGRNAVRAAALGNVSTLLTAGSSVSDRWTRYYHGAS